MSIMNINKKDIGIDLGTCNVRVALKNKGIILEEPTVIAIDQKNGQILATGIEAKEMIGRTPDNITAIKPIKDGVIADFTATELLLKEILRKVCKRYNVIKPRVVVGVPTGITEVEERALQESIIRAGAKEVYLIEEAMAAAIGAKLDIEEPTGNIIADIGGGTTEVAVISLGGIVISTSIRTAGDKLDEDIVEYVKREFGLIIGQTTAEQIKMQVGCAKPLVTETTMQVRGRDIQTGLPGIIQITSNQVAEALENTINEIIEAIKTTLEKTPPELASDLVKKGIYIAGGCSQIKNIDKLIYERTDVPVYITEEPLHCVVKGTEKTIEDLDNLKNVLINSRKR